MKTRKGPAPDYKKDKKALKLHLKEVPFRMIATINNEDVKTSFRRVQRAKKALVGCA